MAEPVPCARLPSRRSRRPAAARGTPAAASRQLPGDDRRLGEVLQSLKPRLTAVATRYTRDRESAGDVVQSAFEKVVRHRRQFRGESQLSTWLYRIVANEAMMWLRAERRRGARRVELPDWDSELLADPAPSAAEALEQRERATRVRAGVVRLRPEERDVLLRCGLEDRSYAQVGAETGVHPAALKSRAFRARQRLSEILRSD